MRKILKWLGLSILLLLVVAVITGAIVLYPYYAMPSESTATIDAKLTAYRQLGEQMKNRPKNDNEAWVALCEEMKPVFAGGKTRRPQWDESGCSLDAIKAQEPLIRQLAPLAARFRTLVDDDFALQAGYEYPALGLTKDLRFNEMRNFLNWETAAAALDAQEGRSSLAAERFATLLRLQHSLANTPELFAVLVAKAIEHTLNVGLIYALPLLSDSDLRALSKQIEQLPDMRAAYLRAMQVEVATMASNLTALEAGTMDDRVLMSLSPAGVDTSDRLVGAALWLARNSGYLRRERYTWVSLSAREIGAWQAWLAAGAPVPEGVTDSDPATWLRWAQSRAADAPKLPRRDEFEHCLLYLNNQPFDDSFSRLMQMSQQQMEQRRHILMSIQAEFQRRQSGQPTVTVRDLHGQDNVVLSPACGRIEKIAPPPAPAMR